MITDIYIDDRNGLDARSSATAIRLLADYERARHYETDEAASTRRSVRLHRQAV